MPELPDRPGPDQPRHPERRSFGGAGPVETAGGTLFPDLLIVGPGRAILDARLAHPGQEAGRTARAGRPELDDVTVTDDRGARYALRLEALSGPGHEPGEAAVPAAVRARVEPAAEPGAAWFELGHRGGPATRLLPSPQAVVQVSPVRPTPAGAAGNGPGAPAGALTETTPGAADRAGYAGLHLDLGAAVPALGGVAIRIDSLVAGPDGWRLFLRAAPEWFAYSADGDWKWTPVTVAAADDLGGGYVSDFGGSSGRGDHAEVTLTFAPRLDPRARQLTLTLRGDAQEVAVVVSLPDAGPGRH